MGVFDRFIPRIVSRGTLREFRSLSTVIASGTRRSVKEVRSDSRPTGVRERQDLSWDLYHTMPEVSSPANWMGNAFFRMRWFVGKDDGGVIVPIKPNTRRQIEVDARAQLASMRTQHSGDIKDLARSYAVQHFVSGESWLVAFKVKGDVFWEMFSYSEIIEKVKGTSKLRAFLKDDGKEFELKETDPTFQLWTRDKQHGNEPFSPVFPILELLEDLRMLQAAEAISDRARASAAGIFFIPQEWDLPSQMSPAGRQLLLVEQLLEASEQAVGDPTHPGSTIPTFVEIPVGKTEFKPFHIRFEPPVDKMAGDKYKRLIGRIALGLDVPSSFITGTSGENHWNAWLASEEGFTSHIAPFAEQFSRDLTHLVLWPALATLGYSKDDREKYQISFDPIDWIIRPNNLEFVRYAHSTMTISDKSFRERIGMSDADAPDQEEIEQRMIRSGIPPQSTLARDRPRATQERVQRGTPDRDEESSSLESLAAVRIASAVDTWFSRARERAGSKVRAKLDTKSNLGKLINNVNNNDVYKYTSRSDLESYGITLTFMLNGCADGLKDPISKLSNANVASQLVIFAEELYAQYFFENTPEVYSRMLTRTVALLRKEFSDNPS